MMQVDLPRDPVQMPDLIVEQGPKNQGMLSHLRDNLYVGSDANPPAQLQRYVIES